VREEEREDEKKSGIPGWQGRGIVQPSTPGALRAFPRELARQGGQAGTTGGPGWHLLADSVVGPRTRRAGDGGRGGGGGPGPSPPRPPGQGRLAHSVAQPTRNMCAPPAEWGAENAVHWRH